MLSHVPGISDDREYDLPRSFLTETVTVLLEPDGMAPDQLPSAPLVMVVSGGVAVPFDRLTFALVMLVAPVPGSSFTVSTLLMQEM